MLKINTTVQYQNGHYAATNSLIPSDQVSKVVFSTMINHHQYQYRFARGGSNDFAVTMDIDKRRNLWISSTNYIAYFCQVASKVAPIQILTDLHTIVQHTGYGYLDTEFLQWGLPTMLKPYIDAGLSPLELERIQALWGFLGLAFTSQYYYINYKGEFSSFGPWLMLLSFKQALFHDISPEDATKWSRGKDKSEIKAAIDQMTYLFHWHAPSLVSSRP